MRKKQRRLELFLIITFLFVANGYLIACSTTNDTSFGDSVETEISEKDLSDGTSDEKLDSYEGVPGDGIINDPYTDFE